VAGGCEGGVPARRVVSTCCVSAAAVRLGASRITPFTESPRKTSANPRAVGEVKTGRADVDDCFGGCAPGAEILAAPVYAGRSRRLDIMPPRHHFWKIHAIAE
jgi:hypothetical protein